MRRPVVSGLFALVASLGVPSVAAASGFVAPEGNLWVKANYSSWQADRKFAGIFDRDPANGVEIGDRVEFDEATGGELDTQMIALTAMFTPLERLHFGAYLPVYQQVHFEDAAFSTKTTGVGDLRPWLGYQVTPNGIAVGTTVNGRLKVPFSTVPRGIESLPISEGQVDLAVEQETSWAVMPRLMLTLRTLFRHRTVFVDEDRRIKPGEEFEVGFTVGGAPIRNVWLKVGYQGLWSTGTEDRSGQGAVTLRERRAVQEALLGGYLSFGRWIGGALRGFALDASIRLPFHGQDYPAGITWAAGLAWSGRLYGSH